MGDQKELLKKRNMFFFFLNKKKKIIFIYLVSVRFLFLFFNILLVDTDFIPLERKTLFYCF
jgi:hypothetical protein